MQSGVLANRLIGIILTVSMLTPSWIGGTCCCFQKLIRKSGSCCAAKTSVAKPSSARKACCANRPASPALSLADQQTKECHPVSPCRCRHKAENVTVVASRQFELKQATQWVTPATPITLAMPLHSVTRWQVATRPGAPPDAPTRCALLCRWLA